MSQRIFEPCSEQISIFRLISNLIVRPPDAFRGFGDITTNIRQRETEKLLLWIDAFNYSARARILVKN